MARFGVNDIDFIDDTAEDLEAIAVNHFEKAMGNITLDDTDPRRKAFQAVAYLSAMIANNIDFTAKMNRLSYAEDSYLDLLGADKTVPRLEATAAETTIRFEHAGIQDFTIPAGIRANAGAVSFVSENEVFIAKETASVDVVFICEETGVIGNNYLPGQINQIENPDELPFISSVSNIDKSFGGAEVEDDDAYAERIRKSNDGYAVAGPSDAYEHFAKSTNQRIVDVYAYSPSLAVVEIVLLMKNNEEATQSELNEVLAVCNDKNIRPLTDKVQVAKAEVVHYDLTVTYYVESVATQSTVETLVNKAVEEYQLWQLERLGRGIDPSELYARLQVTGAKRIVVSPNSYSAIQKNQIAVANSVTVTCEGEIL